VVVPPDALDPDVLIPILRDADGRFRRAYGATGRCAYLVRPDGYVGYRQAPIDTARLVAHLGATFA
jgi:hypothetical protein